MIGSIGVIGGSGAMGSGLAARLSSAGSHVLIGSRDANRSRRAFDSITERWPGSGVATLRGVDNETAATDGDVVIVALPFDGLDLMRSLASKLSGKLVLSVVNRLVVQNGEIVPLATSTSAAQRLQELLPDSQVVTAFNHVSARGLSDPSIEITGDVLVCADTASVFDQAAQVVARVSRLRAVHAGSLALSMVVEDLTAVVLGVNRRRGHRVSFEISREDITES